LWERGTQTVFGAGPADAPVMLVGEQPGDVEDRRGAPFVGPAGRVLDQALARAGIDRSATYVTNVVKHFKWEPRGKRRLHSKPNHVEIDACRPWASGSGRRAAQPRDGRLRRGPGARCRAAALVLIRTDRHAGCTRNAPEKGRATMGRWAGLFFVLAIIAALFGFAGIVAAVAGVARVLFVVFLMLTGISLLLGRRIVA
jgi:uncharacterized membrane protein YtjA (UPF0391 family)